MIPYGRQSISEADIEAVVEVLRSDFLTQGPVIPRFEQAVADYCGARFGVAVNSGTAALHIACLALDLGPGDRLWTSPNTFVASANCGLYCGATVDFVDVVLEGGAVSIDGAGTMVAPEGCVMHESRNWYLTRDQVEDQIKSALGLNRIIWLGQGLAEDRIRDPARMYYGTDGHADAQAGDQPGHTLGQAARGHDLFHECHGHDQGGGKEQSGNEDGHRQARNVGDQQQRQGGQRRGHAAEQELPGQRRLELERAKGFDIFIEVARHNCLSDDGIPEVFVVVFANRKQRQLVVFVGFDIGIDMAR